MFNDDSEQYVGGNFAEDIDDDFFGFRELGLDQELGIAHLSVPLHLLQGRMKKHIEPDGDEDVETVEESHKARPAFAPMNLATATTQIALVRDFLLARLEESESGLIVEDDDDQSCFQWKNHLVQEEIHALFVFYTEEEEEIGKRRRGKRCRRKG